MGERVSHKVRILIVEDNDLNAKFAEIILKKYNVKVDFATNGKNAVEKFLKNDYDLILMDIQMPLMNGIETTAEIRKYEKQLSVKKPIIIIAVTAFALEHDREYCLKSGMDDYITKPYKPSQLLNAIQRHFKI